MQFPETASQLIFCYFRQPPDEISFVLVREAVQSAQGMNKDILDEVHRFQLGTKHLAHAKEYHPPYPLAVNPIEVVEGRWVTGLCQRNQFLSFLAASAHLPLLSSTSESIYSDYINSAREIQFNASGLRSFCIY